MVTSAAYVGLSSPGAMRPAKSEPGSPKGSTSSACNALPSNPPSFDPICVAREPRAGGVSNPPATHRYARSPRTGAAKASRSPASAGTSCHIGTGAPARVAPRSPPVTANTAGSRNSNSATPSVTSSAAASRSLPTSRLPSTSAYSSTAPDTETPYRWYPTRPLSCTVASGPGAITRSPAVVTADALCARGDTSRVPQPFRFRGLRRRPRARTGCVSPGVWPPADQSQV